MKCIVGWITGMTGFCATAMGMSGLFLPEHTSAPFLLHHVWVQRKEGSL